MTPEQGGEPPAEGQQPFGRGKNAPWPMEPQGIHGRPGNRAGEAGEGRAPTEAKPTGSSDRIAPEEVDLFDAWAEAQDAQATKLQQEWRPRATLERTGWNGLAEYLLDKAGLLPEPPDDLV